MRLKEKKSWLGVGDGEGGGVGGVGDGGGGGKSVCSGERYRTIMYYYLVL